MRVIIAGGGTGGHLFPGIAIAEELTMREKTNRVLFVGTVAGLEARVLPRMNIPLRTITVRGIKGKSLIYRLRALTGMPRAVFEAFAIVRDYNPDLVIGLGGYVSGPMLVAAFLAGVRRVIQEQNVIPGTANRIAAHMANRVFVSFEETRSYFAPEKVVVTGNPIRKEFLQLREIGGKEKFGLLVFGGSRGAHRINMAMMDALEFLTDLKPDLKIVHQAGTDDAPQVAQAYEKRGFRA
ncbi:MAG: UDP-N-acetylglucosamine--N-acetylmuramyl-(pentapeptide) pyrophosphoryl-undecaprenol N-acetylglucosamine transferase, partial [Proteobacteria bacterium]|nr:UDP-N-acetylglucosamine--N-acetylmuramyl-(pentapeptide) pyrophosphoryl-undecaprenol N-acetylglucosamine transferase [Pseudomonadota bacterium]NIS72029.1 UDP-N-acetylglucosamine--N-acetylmuramyl-(pentapeptide) pyrophosphoryl-undecaprenol N-acetylglucosamine transferase [Pseudomonadota bacterium]